MKRHVISYILSITSCCCMMACSDFLTESSQNQSNIESYTDLDELLLGAGYMNFYDVDGYYPYVHVMADETEENASRQYFGMDFSNIREQYYGFYTWQQQPSLSYDKYTTYSFDYRDWEKLYRHIKNANSIIEYIDGQQGASERDKTEIRRIKGESYFLRAAYYFTLVNLYGKPYQSTSETDLGVPVNLSSMVEDKQFTRNTVQEVYNRILSDLKIAEEMLDGVATKSIFRADHTAVELLLSRIHLYMCHYGEAAAWAKKVLEKRNGLVDLNTFDTQTDLFMSKSSPEVIFTMGPNVYSDVVSGRIKGFVVRDALYDAMSVHDLRRNVFFYSYDEDTDHTKRCGKYFNYNASVTVMAQLSDNFTFRTAEAYLNLAEAAACDGDETTARHALETLLDYRMEFGFRPTLTETGDALIELIRTERSKELCFEGHRWFDLRRYSVDKAHPQVITLTNSFSVIGAADYGFPIEGGYRYTMPMSDQSNTLPIPEQAANFDNMPNNPRAPRSGESL